MLAAVLFALLSSIAIIYAAAEDDNRAVPFSLPLHNFRSGRTVRHSSRKNIEFGEDLSDVDPSTLSQTLHDSILHKEHYKVIMMGDAMLKDCQLDMDSTRQKLLKCSWYDQIERIALWLGRKLQKEVDKIDPEYDDIYEKVVWLRKNDAEDFLRIVAPHLMEKANKLLETLAKQAVADTMKTKSSRNPNVIFVTAKPGAGKTSATTAVQSTTGCQPISVGQLSRDVCGLGRDNKFCKKIRAKQMLGEAEDAELQIDLLKKELKHQTKEYGVQCFLIDGFPRSAAHIAEWTDEKMHIKFNVLGIIELDIPDEVAYSRVIARSSEQVAQKDDSKDVVKTFPSRLDDNPAVFAERLQYYQTHTVPLLNLFKESAPRSVKVINAQHSKREVANDMVKVVKDFLRTQVKLDL